MEYPCAKCMKIINNYYAHYTGICDNCELLKEYQKQEEEKEKNGTDG